MESITAAAALPQLRQKANPYAIGLRISINFA